MTATVSSSNTKHNLSPASRCHVLSVIRRRIIHTTTTAKESPHYIYDDYGGGRSVLKTFSTFSPFRSSRRRHRNSSRRRPFPPRPFTVSLFVSLVLPVVRNTPLTNSEPGRSLSAKLPRAFYPRRYVFGIQNYTRPPSVTASPQKRAASVYRTRATTIYIIIHVVELVVVCALQRRARENIGETITGDGVGWARYVARMGTSEKRNELRTTCARSESIERSRTVFGRREYRGACDTKRAHDDSVRGAKPNTVSGVGRYVYSSTV